MLRFMVQAFQEPPLCSSTGVTYNTEAEFVVSHLICWYLVAHLSDAENHSFVTHLNECYSPRQTFQRPWGALQWWWPRDQREGERQESPESKHEQIIISSFFLVLERKRERKTRQVSWFWRSWGERGLNEVYCYYKGEKKVWEGGQMKRVYLSKCHE